MKHLNSKRGAVTGWRLLALLMLVALLALTLAACGDDDGDNGDDNGDTQDSGQTDGDSQGEAPSLESGGPSLSGGGPSLGGGASSGDAILTNEGLPGCSDPDSEECPVPLQLPLDGEAELDGIRVNFPSRYFVAESEDVISITPSENNRWEDRASMTFYYADSVEDALAELNEPETATWTPTSLAEGTIGVMRDAEQEPPLNTTIGAFPLEDGRAVVFKMVTTGTYGWDLYSVLYANMLNTVVIEDSASAG